MAKANEAASLAGVRSPTSFWRGSRLATTIAIPPQRGTQMKLQQLSLFLENRPGQLREPCEALAAAGIDLLTMSLADTAQFGILRFVGRRPAQAKQNLEE